MRREARAEDALAIARVQVAAWRAAYRGLMPDVLLDGLDVEAKAVAWRRTVDSTDSQVLVVERAGSVVGSVLVSGAREEDFGAPDCGEICAMYVSPESWRHGCGRELMRGALRFFADTRRRRVILWVLEANAPARRFYEAVGFVADGATRTHLQATSTK